MSERALELIKKEKTQKTGSLDLSHTMLTELPAELRELSWLTILDLSHNLLANLDGLCLPNLIEIDCYHNHLTALDALQYTPNLQILGVQNNQLPNLDGLAETKGLLALECADNGLNNFEGLLHTPLLERLDVTGTALESLEPLHLHALPRLSHLECADNALESLIGVPQTLTQLVCSGNRLQHLQPLAALPNLRILDVGHNPIQPDELCYLPSLEQLWCADLGLGDLSFLTGQATLDTLYCADNKISELTPLRFVPNLTYLNVSCNRIRDLHGIEYTTKLEHLSCSGNHITDFALLEPLKAKGCDLQY